MPLLTWQLRLAKDVVRETCLPTAILPSGIDAGKGGTIDVATFNQDWYSGCCPFRREEVVPDGREENLALVGVVIRR
ncbi:hypothetical protein QUA81_22485 [Microcoleus sp. F6_B4]